MPASSASLQCRDDELLDQVLGGLAQSPKRIDPIWFYDERGAALFDRVCALPEYYLTRAELALMEGAYNDSAGVTAEFNRNALLHLNRRLGADFDVRRFVHRAVWVDAEQRIEMRLRSLCEQVVRLRGHSIEFARNEELITEYCHKYSPEQFEEIAGTAGLNERKQWTDEEWRFS
ncbi:MAG: L-histidine N(alpha)-methyltransferase, partial [Steroidobacteraceae bacterium]